MSKVKLFSFVKCSERSMIASVRIARFVSEELQIPIVTGDDIADTELETLIIVNGAYAFCNNLEALGTAIFEAKNVVWIQNDYTIIPPKSDAKAQSLFRRAFVRRKEEGKSDTMFWSTCEDWAKLPGSSYVNWNCLTYDPLDKKTIVKSRQTRKKELLYYGSWRAASGKSSRTMYFDRYFQSPVVRTTISSPSKNFSEKYGEHELLSYIPPIRENFREELASYGLGLYIEDRMSHERFHSPANRFYEMLSAGLPMVFQPECGTSLRKGGYDTSRWSVANGKNVVNMLARSEEIGAEQQSVFSLKAKKERDGLSGRLKEVYESNR